MSEYRENCAPPEPTPQPPRVWPYSARNRCLACGYTYHVHHRSDGNVLENRCGDCGHLWLTRTIEPTHPWSGFTVALVVGLIIGGFLVAAAMSGGNCVRDRFGVCIEGTR